MAACGVHVNGILTITSHIRPHVPSWDVEGTMPRRAPDRIEVKWPGGFVRAVGVYPVTVTAILVVFYLVLWNWEKIFG